MIYKKARLAPTIDVNRYRQPKAAEQVSAKYITGPVLPFINARNADERDQPAEENQADRA